MNIGHRDASMLPVRPAPFALVAGKALSRADAVEDALRRMGLQPQSLGPCPGGEGPDGEGTRFRIRLGALTLIAGPADRDALNGADPVDPSVSLLASVLPAGWRASGRCWMFRPDAESPAVPDRALFTAMLLLIDLFDASHMFWAPARLWSDAEQVRASIAEMQQSGMPPVLHLVAFRRREDGAAACVGTRGLALFAGREVEARIPAGWTVADVVKRLARLAMDLMLHGPVDAERGVQGLDRGEWVRLVPEAPKHGGPAIVRVAFGGID